MLSTPVQQVFLEHSACAGRWGRSREEDLDFVIKALGLVHTSDRRK